MSPNDDTRGIKGLTTVGIDALATERKERRPVGGLLALARLYPETAPGRFPPLVQTRIDARGRDGFRHFTDPKAWEPSDGRLVPSTRVRAWTRVLVRLPHGLLMG